MTQWTVRFQGQFLPEIVTAPTFLEAVDTAKTIAAAHGLEIIAVEYLAY